MPSQADLTQGGVLRLLKGVQGEFMDSLLEYYIKQIFLEEDFSLSLEFDSALKWMCSCCLLPDKLLIFRNKILLADNVYQKMFRM